MLQIDAILPLYPDDASRHLMLTQAVGYIRDDLASLHRAINSGDQEAALQQVHRAKGTASFLGGNQPELKFFDDLTNVLKQVYQGPDSLPSRSTVPTTLYSKPGQHNALSHDKELIASALRPVEFMLQTLETSLQQLLVLYQPK